MAQKLLFLSLLVVCVTILIFTWLTRGSLCELHIKHGGMEVVASLAYEAVR